MSTKLHFRPYNPKQNLLFPDHKYDGENDIHSMLFHMLKTLCFAAEYLNSKLSEK